MNRLKGLGNYHCDKHILSSDQWKSFRNLIDHYRN